MFADAIVREFNRLAEQFVQLEGDRAQRHRGFALAFRTAKMRGENDFRALFDEQF